MQAAAILKAEVHGIPVPAFASDPLKVAVKADECKVEPFQPRKGMHIETDPKADKKTSSGPAGADDESVIENLIHKLNEMQGSLPAGYQLNPIQVR